MKNKLINITSELFIFVLTFGLVFLLYPPLPFYLSFTIALIVYVFSAIFSFVLFNSIKWLMNKYREWKKSTK